MGLLFLLFYAGFAPARLKSSDEILLFRMTEALFEHGSQEVGPHRHAVRGRDGRLYGQYAIGQAVLALPFYALAQGARHVLPAGWTRALAGPAREVVRAFPAEALEHMGYTADDAPAERSRYGGSLEISFVMLYPAFVGAALAMGVFLLLGRLGCSSRACFATTALIGVCSYPAMMSVYFLRHVSEATAVVFAFVWLRDYRETGHRSSLALGSASAALTFLVRLPGVLAGPALAFYTAFVVLDRRRRAPRPWLPDLAAVALPLGLGVAIHVAVSWQRWGTFLWSPQATEALNRPESFLVALSGFLVAPGISVFAYSPLLLLAPWTLREAARRWPWECAALGIHAATLLLFFSGYRYWPGLWSAPGPRYLLPGCAALLLSLGAWLDAGPGRLGRTALAFLAATGAVVQLSLMLADWSVVARPLVAGEVQALVASGDPASYEPTFDFLWRPAESPILGSLHAVASGSIDAWLWKLARGWPGQPAQPGIAAGLAASWATLCGIGFAWLWRRASG